MVSTGRGGGDKEDKRDKGDKGVGLSFIPLIHLHGGTEGDLVYNVYSLLHMCAV